MVETNVRYIHCNSKEVRKTGRQSNGTPRCKCKKRGKTFQTEYLNQGAKPQTKGLIIKMSLNGSGIRDISRVLGVGQNTVISVFKKQNNGLQT